MSRMNGTALSVAKIFRQSLFESKYSASYRCRCQDGSSQRWGVQGIYANFANINIWVLAVLLPFILSDDTSFLMCRIERLEIFDEMEEWHLIQVPMSPPLPPFPRSMLVHRQDDVASFRTGEDSYSTGASLPGCVLQDTAGCNHLETMAFCRSTTVLRWGSMTPRESWRGFASQPTGRPPSPSRMPAFQTLTEAVSSMSANLEEAGLSRRVFCKPWSCSELLFSVHV